MKRDKLFRLSLAILFLWTSLALAAPAAMAASSTALPGSSLWEPYLQQSRIDLEKAASSPWETLKSFLPRSFGALVRQTASRYTSVLLFLTLTAVLGLLAGECTDGALLDLVAAGGCGVLLWGSLLEEARSFVSRWRAGAAFSALTQSLLAAAMLRSILRRTRSTPFWTGSRISPWTMSIPPENTPGAAGSADL